MNILSKALLKFEELRDRFLPAELKNEAHDLSAAYHFRLVAGMLIISILVAIAFVLYHPFFNRMNLQSTLAGATICITLSLFHVNLLCKLKLQKCHKDTAKKLVVSLFLAILIGVLFTGGIFGSQTPMFLPLPIMLAFLLIDRKTGIRYALLTLCVFITLIALHFIGVELPQTIDDNERDAVTTMLWLYYITCFFSLVMAYDDLTFRLIKQNKHEQKLLAYIASHDDLTGLANRKQFDEKLNIAVHRADRTNIEVALLLIDLNKFKPINDNYGHDAGDTILKHVAQQILNTTRLDDTAARIGGDEFAIIVQGETTNANLRALAQRLLNNIEKPVNAEGQRFIVSASIGIAQYPQTADIEHLRKAADMAMYSAKAENKGYLLFSELN